ncbi:MAG TPA: carbohydrate kinase [Planctomycetota bacterium]|nr:carbohydrate kinase [Planctomycetota bacterium]
MQPLALPPNVLHRFYRGGARIAAFRGIDVADDHAPEEWLGSTTTAWGEDEIGLSPLPDGRTVREAVAADPESFLGPGVDEPEFLVKLLDAGERLPVHFHPGDAFARRELGLARGKTEAWLILEGGEIAVGWREPVERAQVEAWVEEQDTGALYAALTPARVEPGDVVYVPAGAAHAIGAGIFMVEVQQASDLSILLEWDGFALDGRRDGNLGLGLERALDALSLAAGAPIVGNSLPPEADAFFRAERVRGGDELDAAFSIVVGVDGSGALGGVPLARGDALLVPYGAGTTRVEGDVEAIRCLR